MSKKTDFIEFVSKNISDFKMAGASDDVIEYWEAFCSTKETNKPKFTDNGKVILKFMQDNKYSGKARDIAEELFISPKGVSGSMRKLVTDGYVEKLGQDPAVYSLTELGKNTVIE